MRFYTKSISFHTYNPGNVPKYTYHFLFLLLPPDVRLDRFPDGELAGPLADLGEIGAGEAAGHLCQVRNIHILGHRGLAQVGLQDVHAGTVVGQRDVDQLIQAARPGKEMSLQIWI